MISLEGIVPKESKRPNNRSRVINLDDSDDDGMSEDNGDEDDVEGSEIEAGSDAYGDGDEDDEEETALTPRIRRRKTQATRPRERVDEEESCSVGQLLDSFDEADSVRLCSNLPVIPNSELQLAELDSILQQEPDQMDSE